MFGFIFLDGNCVGENKPRPILFSHFSYGGEYFCILSEALLQRTEEVKDSVFIIHLISSVETTSAA